jgi:hypothetical protein
LGTTMVPPMIQSVCRTDYYAAAEMGRPGERSLDAEGGGARRPGGGGRMV